MFQDRFIPAWTPLRSGSRLPILVDPDSSSLWVLTCEFNLTANSQHQLSLYKALCPFALRTWDQLHQSLSSECLQRRVELLCLLLRLPVLRPLLCISLSVCLMHLLSEAVPSTVPYVTALVWCLLPFLSWLRQCSSRQPSGWRILVHPIVRSHS